jgi:hypothetical protein
VTIKGDVGWKRGRSIHGSQPDGKDRNLYPDKICVNITRVQIDDRHETHADALAGHASHRFEPNYSRHSRAFGGQRSVTATRGIGRTAGRAVAALIHIAADGRF